MTRTFLLSLAFALPLCLGLPPTTLAQESSESLADTTGHVQIPVDLYNQLIEQSRSPVKLPRQTPAAFAFGRAQVTVTAETTQAVVSARVQLDLSVEVLDDDWVLVPLLPAATAVDNVTIDGGQVQLVPSPEGLAWATKARGSHRAQITYRVDAWSSGGGHNLALPLPRAASINLVATLPGTGLDVSVIPAAGLRTTTVGANTQVTATVPTSSGAQISWRAPSERSHALSRARYTGQLEGDAVVFKGEIDVELFAAAGVTLPLLPRSVTLGDVQVDGKAAPILLEGSNFATVVRGQGTHRVSLEFHVPVASGEGPPRIQLALPEVPVTRLDLRLPGRKEVTTSPQANVQTRSEGNRTVATIFAPMTRSLSLAWTEAVPEDVRAEVRTNSSVYHLVHAEEGVLYVQARLVFEITRGETNSLELSVPSSVQVNRVSSPLGAVADWRIAPGESAATRTLTVFLDRQASGELPLDVWYDRSLGGDGLGAEIELPLLRTPQAQRQRGMIALLASRDLELSPVEEGEATRVGENQLPPFVRQDLDMTIAHTFKYVEDPPQMVVSAAAPERQAGQFDAQVDTLFSLGEVTLQGQASVVIALKSGGISELELEAPASINLLNLSGPSLRTYDVEPEDARQRIRVEFTQDMEGEFRLDLSYEQILEAAVEGETPTIDVPTVRVIGSDVEQGRIALEALSAVEVEAAAAERLTALDVSELPRQLILQTTNPILLAYKYVRQDPGPRLELQVTRHELLEVQEAAIDLAHYRTLFTRDGLEITIAHFEVRNSKKQFLRITLPEGAEIWSASVGGRPEQPALAHEPEAKGREVLLKILHSNDSYPVELVYATEGPKIRGLGRARGTLPRPDILVTTSRWDVYLPPEMRYAEPKTNLEMVSQAPTTSTTLDDEMSSLEGLAQQAVTPLRIQVPQRGTLFSFEKLYANQGDEEAWFSIRYASRSGAGLGAWLSALSALLLWVGVLLRFFKASPLTPQQAWIVSGVGVIGLILTVGVYGVGLGPVFATSLVVALVAGLYYGRLYWARHLETRAPESTPGNTD